VSAIQNKLYDIQNQFVYDFKGNTGIMSSKYKQASAQTLTKEQTINHAVKRTSLITTSQSVNIKPTAENNGYTLAILIAGGFSVIVAAALTRKSRRAKHEEK
jgi:hypothetical protein